MTPTKELDRACGMWIDKETVPFRSPFKDVAGAVQSIGGADQITSGVRRQEDH